MRQSILERIVEERVPDAEKDEAPAAPVELRSSPGDSPRERHHEPSAHDQGG